MIAPTFDQAGYSIVPSVLTSAECDAVLANVAVLNVTAAGARNLLLAPWCEAVAIALKDHGALSGLLPVDAVAMQCTLFSKSPETNWFVTWHQDLSIPVGEKIDTPQCSGWSEKEGVIYTQPPVPVLEKLVAVRVHLDACGADNGPLRVIPGSHRRGRIPEGDIANRWNRPDAGEECHVPRAGALVMRPLLLHASSKIRAFSPRRVLHFLFGPRDLPLGLRWHHAV